VTRGLLRLCVDLLGLAHRVFDDLEGDRFISGVFSSPIMTRWTPDRRPFLMTVQLVYGY
jgi:hypothetical protein